MFPVHSLLTYFKLAFLDAEKAGDQYSDEDNVIVTWDSPEDPSNPRNWSSLKKWTNVAIVSAQGTISPVASTALASGSFVLTNELHVTNSYVLSLPVALYVLGLGLGPLWLAPLSELYGRRQIYVSCYIAFTLLTVGCALSPNITCLSILRLFTGMAGSAGPSIGGGTIGDMFDKKESGKAQALFGFGPTGGPVIGGVIGGFIAAGTPTWRWLMWVMAIAAGVTTLISILFLRETYAPFILSQKLKRLRKETGNKTLQTEVVLDAKELFSKTLFRPIRLLFCEPVCTVMSIYMALIYGILYLHLVTIPLLYGSEGQLYGLYSYDWKNGLVGLAYLGGGAGSITSTVFCALFLNRAYLYMVRRNARKNPSQGPPKESPEYRMPPMQLGMLLVPLGLFIFAWTAANASSEGNIHWVLPLVGAAVFCFGMLITYICIQTYLVDVFRLYGASALAAAIVLRSLFGCVFSVIGYKLYVALGYGWGTSLLGFLTLAFVPVPWFLYVYGERLRGGGDGSR
ncbi:MAG: hypothetical protein M1834_004685 [Cirrosporium novae-zelandiae]|nr:MAG: hypothetical protein M1834_004685 [Cirrosporium novae-zelandiae]